MAEPVVIHDDMGPGSVTISFHVSKSKAYSFMLDSQNKTTNVDLKLECDIGKGFIQHIPPNRLRLQALEGCNGLAWSPVHLTKMCEPPDFQIMIQSKGSSFKSERAGLDMVLHDGDIISFSCSKQRFEVRLVRNPPLPTEFVTQDLSNPRLRFIRPLADIDKDWQRMAQQLSAVPSSRRPLPMRRGKYTPIGNRSDRTSPSTIEDDADELGLINDDSSTTLVDMVQQPTRSRKRLPDSSPDSSEQSSVDRDDGMTTPTQKRSRISSGSIPATFSSPNNSRIGIHYKRISVCDEVSPLIIGIRESAERSVKLEEHLEYLRVIRESLDRELTGVPPGIFGTHLRDYETAAILLGRERSEEKYQTRKAAMLSTLVEGLDGVHATRLEGIRGLVKLDQEVVKTVQEIREEEGVCLRIVEQYDTIHDQLE
ncbi:hypothetical protein KCU73_g4591, partial [Aureobasidium melanogenum]